MIILYNCGGNRPMGETAPNAVLYGGGGKPPPTRFYMEAIERLLRGY
uniref:Uncharacterized protein n=1 Tax=viral metagenome TaxID=1070528 RepID=A0A6C0LBV9_9ZZZZ